MTIRDTVSQLQIASKQAKVNIEDVPRGNRPGHQMLIQQAKVDLEKLRRDLETALVPRGLVGLFGHFPGPLATMGHTMRWMTDNGGVVLDADKLWGEIAHGIEPTIGSDRMWRTTQHFLAFTTIRRMIEDAEIPYPRIATPEYEEVLLPTFADTQSFVRRKVRAAAGDNLHRAFLTRDLIEGVSEMDPDFLEDRIPVLVVGAAPEEVPAIAALFSYHREHTFPVDFVPSGETILPLFKRSK